MQNTFNQKDIKWLDALKYILIFCVLTCFITTLDKSVDYLSMFIQLLFLFMVTAQMTQYLNNYFYFFLGMIIFTILYDLIDCFALRGMKFKKTKGLRFWVALFGFLGFLGKILWLIFFWVAKSKVFSKSV